MLRLEINVLIDNYIENKCLVLEIIIINEFDEFNIVISFIFKFVLYIY